MFLPGWGWLLPKRRVGFVSSAGFLIALAVLTLWGQYIIIFLCTSAYLYVEFTASPGYEMATSCISDVLAQCGRNIRRSVRFLLLGRWFVQMLVSILLCFEKLALVVKEEVTLLDVLKPVVSCFGTVENTVFLGWHNHQNLHSNFFATCHLLKSLNSSNKTYIRRYHSNSLDFSIGLRRVDAQRVDLPPSPGLEGWAQLAIEHTYR
jgi:hypothetical protein